MKLRTYRTTTRVAAWAIAAGVSVAAALPASAALDEIVVTVQKREQNIQDVPVAVSAFSGEFLNATGSVDIFDLADYTPALYLTQSQTATQTVISIRGIGTSSNNAGFEPSVGVFIDGVYRSRTGTAINDLVDIERIEVARGPQGTLFGRNTSAGTVSIFTKAPEFEFGGFAELSVGNLGYFNAKGAMTGPVAEDKLAARISGFYTQRDGYITNINDGTEINDRDRWGLRGNLLFTPNESFTARLIVDYSEANELCCSAAPRVNGATDAIIGALGGTVLSGSDFFKREVALSTAPISNSQDWGVSLQIDWDLGSHTVTSITGYRDYNFFSSIDADFTDIELLPVNSRKFDQNAWTQEVRIANNNPGKLEYVGGFFYFTQNLDMEEHLRFGADTNAYLTSLPAFAALAPLYTIFGIDLFPDGGGANDFHEQDHRAWAVFGQGTYHFNDQLSFTGGIRFTKEKKTLTSVFTEIPDGGVFIPAIFIPPAGFNTFFSFAAISPIPDATSGIKDEKVTGTAKIQYAWTPDIQSYISYSRGYKSGGTNVARVVPAAIAIPFGLPVLPVTFDAETVNSYEAGIKSQLFDNRLRLNVAGYYAEYNNFQNSTFVGTGFLVQNAGKITAHGVEAEGVAQPTDWLTLEGTMTYQKVKFDSFRSGPCPLGAVPDGDVFGTCNLSGNNVTNSPKWTLHGAATIEQPLGGSVIGYLRGEATYRSKQDTDPTNSAAFKQKAYTLVNARAGLRTDDGKWDLTFWAKNLTKENYILLGFVGVLQTTAYAYPNEPRTYGVTVRTQF